MSNQIYSDGIANIRIVDGVMRYDHITLNPGDEKGKLKAKSVATVSTSLQGMLRSYDQLSKVIDDLVEKGVLKKGPPSEPVVEKTVAH